ncbi:hypothetical protein [Caballeronia sp. LZ001]|nr:hypothetical protein [Caballeronia sp. LZ001]MDR5798849.1 hypothetical protein [Caballeronia sp. LZ001]
MPKNLRRLNAENSLAPLCRKRFGSLTAKVHNAFRWVKENREFLFRHGRFQFVDAAGRQPHFDRFKGSISDRPGHEQTIELLSALFPTLTELAGTRGFIFTEPYFTTATRRGIATEAGYDAYFLLTPSSDAIPKRIIDDITSADVMLNEVTSIISTTLGKRDTSGVPMVIELLMEVGYRFDAEPPPTLTASLLGGLFEASGSILAEPTPLGSSRPAPGALLATLVFTMLEKQDEEATMRLLLPAYEACSSLDFCVETYFKAASALEEIQMFPHRRRTPFIGPQCLQRIGELLLGKLTAAKNDKSLNAVASVWGLVPAWQNITKNDDAKNWFSEQVRDDLHFAVRVVRGFATRRNSDGEVEYSFTDDLDPTLYDSIALSQAVQKHLREAQLSDDERHLLQTVSDGFKKGGTGGQPAES